MNKINVIIGMLLVTGAAHAEYAMRNQGEVTKFSTGNPGVLKPFTADYSYRVIPFNEWSGVEKKLMNLHPDFQSASTNPLIMYIAKVSFIVDRPAAAIDLNRMLTVQAVKNLDDSIQPTEINPKDVITYQKKDQAYRNPSGPARWCDDPKHTLCLQSLFKLPASYQAAFAVFEKVVRHSPYGTLEGQSEVRVVNESDIDNASDLRQLTGIATQPASILVQNTFWLTHAIEYIKVLGVVQPHPLEANRSIVTGYMAFGIEKKTWDMHIPILNCQGKDLMLGQCGNTSEGILSGLPNLTQHISVRLAEEMEKR